MEIEVKVYTKELIQDVLDFEARLRKEEDFWGWEIDGKYIDSVKKSFDDPAFDHSLSLLAYVDDKVVGRIDSSIIASHFDGSKKSIFGLDLCDQELSTFWCGTKNAF